MKTLITYPIGLLLRVYLAYAKFLIMLEERKAKKNKA